MRQLVERLSLGRDRLSTLHDLGMPAVGMYVGLGLAAALPQSPGWGMIVFAVSGGLFFLRLHPATVGQTADIVQVALGFLVGLPLALDVDGWKQITPAPDLLFVWLISCVLVAVPVLRLKREPIQLGFTSSGADRVDLTWIALLIAGGLLLRIPEIETLPAGVDPDEGSLARSAAATVEGMSNDPFSTGWATHQTLQFFVNGLFVQSWGHTFPAMRLPSAIIGSLAIAALYLLGRVGYGRRVAVVAGILGLASDVAVHFSRLGINNISDNLFSPLVLAGLWFAGARGSSLVYVLTGLFLGLSQYYYFGNRAIPFIVVANLIVWCLADRRGVLCARFLILGMFVVALVVFLPLLGHMVRNPGSITEHLFLTMPFSDRIEENMARMNLPAEGVWLYRITASLLIFAKGPDQGGFYHSGRSMLHSLQVPFFLIGLGAIIFYWRRPFNRGLLLWMITTLTLGSVLITDVATFHRLLGVLPAGILLAAIGIDAELQIIARSFEWRPLPWTSFAIILSLLLAIADAHYYFLIYSREIPYRTESHEAIALAAFDYTRLKGEGTFILLTQQGVGEDGTIYHELIRYVAGSNFRGGTPQTLEALNSGQPAYFYVLPDQASMLLDLSTRFPGGTIKEYRRLSDNLLLMTRYAVAPTPTRTGTENQ